MAVGSSAPNWRGGRHPGAGFLRGEKRVGNGTFKGRVGGVATGGSGSAGGVSPRRHSSSGTRDGKYPPPPPPGRFVAQSGEGWRCSCYVGGVKGEVRNIDPDTSVFSSIFVFRVVAADWQVSPRRSSRVSASQPSGLQAIP